MRIVVGAAILAAGLGVSYASGAHAASPAAAAGPQAAGAGAKLSVQDHEARMKNISSTNATLRMKLMNNQLADAAKDAQQLALLFGDVEKFWAQHNKADAMKWAEEGRKAAAETAGAATAGDGAKAQTAAAGMLASCKQCHAAYREGDAQAGYRLKAGVIAE